MLARLRASLQRQSRRFHVKHPDEESTEEASSASVITTDAPPAAVEPSDSDASGDLDAAVTGSGPELGDQDADTESVAPEESHEAPQDASPEESHDEVETNGESEQNEAADIDPVNVEPAESETAESETADIETADAESAVAATDTGALAPVEPNDTTQIKEVPINEVAAVIFDDTPLARELSEITRRRQALAAETLPLPTATRVFTVANQKGGVGKTTSTVNLAAALARNGARVLVIDLDPQGNASTALGIEHRSETISVYDVIINDEPMSHVVQKSPEFDELYCIPATIHLAGAEIELVSLVAREQRLRTALDLFLAESEEMYHYVFIDCPPSLGLLTINAFVAAKEVLIPIQCEYYALEGLSQLLKNIQLIERHLNPTLSVSTILLTMYDGRTNLANQVAQDVRDHFPDQVLDTLIPRSVRISEAPSYGQSVISYDANSPGSLSYLEAAAEMARRGAPN
jgi:chromosome partitioning protein